MKIKKLNGILCLIIATLIVFGTSGCGKIREKRIMYNRNLSDIVKIEKYKGLKVDTESEDYKGYYDSELEEDIQSNELYDTISDGKVFKGDIANIDYEGKIDGVAFEGGTAKGYDLTIGSGQFIPGFEDGLIGATIGATVDLKLTFPNDYGNVELIGKNAVFTVKVNSVKRAMSTKAIANKLDFKDENAYLDNVAERAAKNCLRDAIVDKVEISEYPKEEQQLMQPIILNQIDTSYQQQYNVTLEEYLSYIGQTSEDFNKLVYEHELKPIMKQQMALYFIFDEEELSLPKNAINNQIEKQLSLKTMSAYNKEKLIEYYGEYYFEALAVDEAVMEYVYKNAMVK